MADNDNMKTVRVLNQFDKYVFIDVSEDLYNILVAKVKKLHSSSVEKMTLLQDLNLDIDKLMLTSVTEQMVNESVNELINKS